MLKLPSWEIAHSLSLQYFVWEGLQGPGLEQCSSKYMRLVLLKDPVKLCTLGTSLS